MFKWSGKPATGSRKKEEEVERSRYLLRLLNSSEWCMSSITEFFPVDPKLASFWIKILFLKTNKYHTMNKRRYGFQAAIICCLFRCLSSIFHKSFFFSNFFFNFLFFSNFINLIIIAFPSICVWKSHKLLSDVETITAGNYCSKLEDLNNDLGELRLEFSVKGNVLLLRNRAVVCILWKRDKGRQI